jgi:S1-C subfamily serine protease
MPQAALLCPSCSASLKLPENVPDGVFLKCPKCAARFRRSAAKTTTPSRASEFWEQVRLDDLAAPGAAPWPAAQPPADRPAVSPEAPAEPATPPAATRRPAPAGAAGPRRGWLVGVAAGAVGLSICLGIALVIAVSDRGGPKPEQPPRPSPDPTAAPVVAKADAAPPPAPPLTVAEPPKPPEPPAWAFERWVQDFDQAQRLAKEQNKDVLLLFDCSDWSPPSQALADEVFARPELWRRLTDRFVPVHLDFPENATARRRVQDAGRNEALRDRFFKDPAYPRVVLADAAGRPYAIELGYVRGAAEQYVAGLEKKIHTREDRDDKLAAVDQAEGAAKLPAANKALQFLAVEVQDKSPPRADGLRMLRLGEFYAPLLRSYRALADAHDPANAGGYQERFFYHEWGARAAAALARGETGPGPRALADEFAAWRAKCPPHDPEFGPSLLCRQADLLERLADRDGRERVLRDALALNPTPAWRAAVLRKLGNAAQAHSGTGFAVGPDVVVTNYHVAGGPGAVRVRLPDKQRLPATVVAEDPENDLALLKVALPAGVRLPPLRVAPTVVTGPGTAVATLGYALGGTGQKFTQGPVSQREGGAGKPTLLVLNVTVNPGNSGGPLLDLGGNVVGVVTWKTVATETVDSYGIAHGADVLDQFLRKHLRGYKPSSPLGKRADWAEVNRQVGPSVVQVLKAAR